MESKVKFRDRQELQSADLNNVEDFAQAAIDHIVLDAIEDGQAYAGFDVSKTASIEVTCDPGRLYDSGRVYARDESVVLDLTNALPLVTKKRVAIVAYGQEVETDTQPRDFLVDAQTGETEPQSVPMEILRRCEISTVAGTEGADPTYPTTDASVTVIAYVLLTTTGVESVEQWTVNQVNNLSDLATDVDALEAWRSDVSSRVDTLQSDLSALALNAIGHASKEDVERLAAIIDDLMNRLSELEAQPVPLLWHHVEHFNDDDDANTADGDYAALVDEGLHFPEAATSDATCQLLNPNDTKVIVSGGGVCLPYHTHRLHFHCTGYHRHHRCGQWTWHGHSCRKWGWSHRRWRHGSCWFRKSYRKKLLRYLESAISRVLKQNSGAWADWNAGDWTVFWAYLAAKGIDRPHVEEFCRDGLHHHHFPHWHWPFGHTTEVVTAYHLSNTFTASQDGWLTKIGLYFTQLDSAGDVDVLVVELDNAGRPMIDAVLSKTTLAYADINIGSGSGGAGLPSIVETEVPLDPVPLKAGERYGVILSVKGDHYCAIDDYGHQHLHGAFWVWSSGAWAIQTGAIKMKMYTAIFPETVTQLDLQPLSLAGGIRNIDILGESLEPGASAVSWQVQLGGVWYAIDDPNLDLSSLPALLPFRAVFNGSPDIAAGHRLATINVRCARSATAFHYVSDTRALLSNATTITVKALLTDFDETPHDLTCTVYTVGDTVTETADATADVTLPDGSIERTWTFNITADDDYHYELVGSTTSAENQFTVERVIDYAET